MNSFIHSCTSDALLVFLGHASYMCVKMYTMGLLHPGFFVFQGAVFLGSFMGLRSTQSLSTMDFSHECSTCYVKFGLPMFDCTQSLEEKPGPGLSAYTMPSADQPCQFECQVTPEP